MARLIRGIINIDLFQTVNYDFGLPAVGRRQPLVCWLVLFCLPNISSFFHWASSSFLLTRCLWAFTRVFLELVNLLSAIIRNTSVFQISVGLITCSTEIFLYFLYLFCNSLYPDGIVVSALVSKAVLRRMESIWG